MFAGRRIPELPIASAGGGEAQAVGTVGDAHGSVQTSSLVDRQHGRAGLHLPDPDRPVVVGRDDPPAVRAERQPTDGVGVSPEEAYGSAARRVPESHDHVIAGRGDPPAVGAVRHGANLVGVSCEGQEFPGGRFRDRRSVPDPDRAVLARRGQPLAVGAEGHGDRVVRVPVQGEGLLAGARVPDLDLVIEAGGGEPPAVGAVRHAPDDLAVSLQGAEEPAGRDVPDLDGAVILREDGAAGHGEVPAVGAVGRAMAPAGVAGQDSAAILPVFTSMMVTSSLSSVAARRVPSGLKVTSLNPFGWRIGPDQPVGRRVPDHDRPCPRCPPRGRSRRSSGRRG